MFRKTIFVMLIMLLPVYSFAKITEITDLAKGISEDQVAKEKNILFQKNLAIKSFTNNSPSLIKYNTGSAVAELLSTEMNRSAIFRLVEREHIDKVLGEIELGMTGVINSDSAAQAGQLTGADCIIIGTVSEVGESILISARLISTTTGEVISSRQVTVPREKLLAESREIYWSSFSSNYGIGLMVNSLMVYSTDAKRFTHITSIDASYRFFRYLRVSAGGYYLSTNEFYREKIIMDATKPNSISMRNYNVKLGGPKVAVDLIYPVFRWFNAILRVEYFQGAYNVLEQDVTDVPVYIVNYSDNTNKLITRRVLVNSWNDDKVPQLINMSLRLEFLVSKRLSLQISGGYLYATDFTPSVYESSGNRNWSDDVDTNGTFPEYNYYNFARRGANNERVSINLSGYSFAAGIGIHF